MSIKSVDHIESSHPDQTAKPPPLNSGDHLTRQEFERRYEAHPAKDMTAILATLQEGLTSAEHADFVSRLQLQS